MIKSSMKNIFHCLKILSGINRIELVIWYALNWKIKFKSCIPLTYFPNKIHSDTNTQIASNLKFCLIIVHAVVNNSGCSGKKIFVFYTSITFLLKLFFYLLSGFWFTPFPFFKIVSKLQVSWQKYVHSFGLKTNTN